MFTVNIKGKRDPKNINFVKLEMVFYKRGYARVTKVINITGLYSEWNQKSQLFVGKDSSEKNKFPQQQRLKYLKIGERWDAQGKNWIPVELSHYYDTDPNYRNKYIPISDIIEELAVEFENQKRYKNGRVLKSLSTSRKYQYLNTSLHQFTKSKYHQDFSKYRFRDLTEKFIQDFVVWIQIQAAKNGTSGDVSGKLRKLRAVCLHAKEQGVYNVNLHTFQSFKEKLKQRITTPKGVSPEVMQQIETFDRILLTNKEQLYLDLFLFSYYAGGMSAIDVCLLTQNQIKGDMIIYERTKYDKQARVIIIDKAVEIIERYRSEAYMNYVFPTIKRCNPTQSKLYGRVKRINEKVNQTLQKICDHCGIKSRVTWGTARSSYISKMIDEGFHPLQVAELAGNSPQTIYRHYYTIYDKEKMKKRMNEVL
ncbi:tyrosine-type recombinase/integrase [Bacteroides helcogenes]|uniref:Integrase family protein n=1 Tax=Bacteroides helcogenes (strain ATCC 35417 / DSM 20613 / JCM 6297 / CCUG 15421 / P 36-108) TaxID=693979 RepID=E6SWS5_BACT6|nr:tyrosine-type recombinase/integrase [Bacteroides helcogenes]ADV43627.1 integrase family protein [Bacteroides helcogenes P 36-108]MDY5239349.1 tyrosine-type recombinase/integrase [Bacteroides helcogenes]